MRNSLRKSYINCGKKTLNLDIYWSVWSSLFFFPLKQSMSEITLFYSSVSSNLEIKKHQQRIEMILDGKKIPYSKVDIAADSAEKDRMRFIAGNERALPPQLANGDKYCGDYDAFDEAVEFENLESFFHLN